MSQFVFELSAGRSARIKVDADTREQAEALARDAAIDYIDQYGGRIEADELAVKNLTDEDWFDWSIRPAPGGTRSSHDLRAYLNDEDDGDGQVP